MTYGHKKSLRPEALGETVALTGWSTIVFVARAKVRIKNETTKYFWEKVGKMVEKY